MRAAGRLHPASHLPVKPKYTVDQLLSPYPPEVCGIVDVLRQLVHGAVPYAIEAVHPLGGGIRYQHREHGYFCSIVPFRDCVRLTFAHGDHLHDPAHLLGSVGKHARALDVRPGAGIPTALIQDLLRQAARFTRPD